MLPMTAYLIILDAFELRHASRLTWTGSILKFRCWRNLMLSIFGLPLHKLTLSHNCEHSFFCIGFSQRSIYGNVTGMGNNPGSWAYHSDNGRVYACSLGSNKHSVSDTSEKFGKGCVVGCGLNMKTGQGYRTLNGSQVDCGMCPHKFGLFLLVNNLTLRFGTGNIFDMNRFDTGKVWPIVAFECNKLGLTRFRVILRESAEHQFLFRGPYNNSAEDGVET